MTKAMYMHTLFGVKGIYQEVFANKIFGIGYKLWGSVMEKQKKIDKLVNTFLANILIPCGESKMYGMHALIGLEHIDSQMLRYWSTSQYPYWNSLYDITRICQIFLI